MLSKARISARAHSLFLNSTSRVQNLVNDFILTDLFLKGYIELITQYTQVTEGINQTVLTKEQQEFVHFLYQNRALWQAQNIQSAPRHYGANSDTRLQDLSAHLEQNTSQAFTKSFNYLLRAFDSTKSIPPSARQKIWFNSYLNHEAAILPENLKHILGHGLQDLARYHCFNECFESLRWRLLPGDDSRPNVVKLSQPKGLAVNSCEGDSDYCALVRQYPVRATMQCASTRIDQSEHTAEVNLETGACTCPYSKEFADLPCRHMFKVFANDGGQGRDLFAKLKLAQFWTNKHLTLVSEVSPPATNLVKFS